MKKKNKKAFENLSYIQHGGYTVVQASSYQVTVYKDGHAVMISSMTRRMSEDELRDHVEFVHKIRSKR